MHAARSSTNPTRPRVALLIESSRAYGRGLLRGIAAYARTHGPWSIFHHERALGDDAPRWLRRGGIDGVIARVESRRLIQQIRRLGCPAIDLRGLHDLADIPLVETDDAAVVRLAIDHLLSRGFEHLAFCGLPGANFSDCRLRHFRQQTRELEIEPHVFDRSPRPEAGRDTSELESRAVLDQQKLAAWIAGLPRPVGVMACNDVRAQQVLNACRAVGRAVPDEVAVIGVDDDEILCELSDPPLSSVAPNTWRIGFEAAGLLTKLMHGEAAGRGTRFIEPRGVVTRQSTDVLAIADPQIAAAVRYIREHAVRGISVDDVLEQVPLSRSVLERRFAKLLGRSPKAEINRVRLERVKRLLAETDYTLPAIASLTGYRHAEYMCAVFKQKTGQTPGEYRRQVAG